MAVRSYLNTPCNDTLLLNTGISCFKVNYLLLDYGERIRSFMGDYKGRVGRKAGAV